MFLSHRRSSTRGSLTVFTMSGRYYYCKIDPTKPPHVSLDRYHVGVYNRLGGIFPRHSLAEKNDFILQTLILRLTSWHIPNFIIVRTLYFLLPPFKRWFRLCLRLFIFNCRCPLLIHQLLVFLLIVLICVAIKPKGKQWGEGGARKAGKI